MSSTESKALAVITEWNIGARGHNAAIGGMASFTIVDLDVSAILKKAEDAVLEALKEENISGDIATLELRIAFERRARSDQTTITGHVRLLTVTKDSTP